MAAFPDIPGVTFRPTGVSDRYAVSSDGRVWVGHRGPWRPMTPYTGPGGPSVWFTFQSGGGRAYAVADLVAKAFPEKS